MKNKTIKLILGIVLLAALTGGYLGVKSYVAHQEEAGSEQEEEKTDVFTTETDQIASLKFMIDQKEVSFEKENETWSIKDDSEFPVDQEKLTTAATDISSVTAARVLQDVEDLAEYGLDNPQNTITISCGDETTTLRVGIKNESTSQYYINKNEDKNTVYVVEESLITPFMNSLYDYAQMQTFPNIDASQIQKITVTQKETPYQVLKDNAGIWHFENNGEPEKADTTKINSLTSSIGSLEYDTFVDYNCTDKTKYGLENPYAILTVDYEEEAEEELTTSEENEPSTTNTESETSNETDTSEENTKDLETSEENNESEPSEEAAKDSEASAENTSESEPFAEVVKDSEATAENASESEPFAEVVKDSEATAENASESELSEEDIKDSDPPKEDITKSELSKEDTKALEENTSESELSEGNMKDSEVFEENPKGSEPSEESINESEPSEGAEPEMVAKQLTVLIGNEADSDSRYVMVDGSKEVYTMTKDLLSTVIDKDISTMLDMTVYYLPLTELNSLDVELNEQKTTINVSRETIEADDEENTEENIATEDPDTTTEDEDSENTDTESTTKTETITKYTMNGEELDSLKFSTFYNKLITLTAQKRLMEEYNPENSPIMITVFHNLDNESVNVDFYEYDVNYYAAVVDNKVYLINKMTIKEIIESYEQLTTQEENDE